MSRVIQSPALVPEFVDDEGGFDSREARTFWKRHWQGRRFIAIGMLDPTLGSAVMRGLHGCIKVCPVPLELVNGVHFLLDREVGSGDSGTFIVAAASAAWAELCGCAAGYFVLASCAKKQGVDAFEGLLFGVIRQIFDVSVG